MDALALTLLGIACVLAILWDGPIRMLLFHGRR